mgnify:CR=1 FL=1
MKFDLNDVYQDFKSLMENSIKAQFAESKSIPPVLFIGIESKSEIGKIEAAILPADEFLQDVNGKNALSNLMKQIVKENFVNGSRFNKGEILTIKKEYIFLI